MADLRAIPRSTPTNKSYYPILEPIVDAAAFIGSGILATSYLTTWINDPVSNSGIALAGILSASSIQLAKKILPLNDSIVRKMVSTIMGLGLPTISLPYLPTSLVGVITLKAAFQIGAINLSVKVVIYALQYLRSMKVTGRDSSGVININFPLSQDPNVIKKYSKNDATSAHATLLYGGRWLQIDAFAPDFAAYKAYLTLFQQHNLLIDAPKSVQEIENPNTATLVLYLAYYKNDPQSWMKLPLPVQYQFKELFQFHAETSEKQPFFLYPSNKTEIEGATQDHVTYIHGLAIDNSKYWKELKFQEDLNTAFKKFRLDEIGLSRDPNVIQKYSKDEATNARAMLLNGHDLLTITCNADFVAYEAYVTLFQQHSLLIDAPKSVQEIADLSTANLVLYLVYYKNDPQKWLQLPLPMQHQFKMVFEFYPETCSQPAFFLYPSTKAEIDQATKDLIICIHEVAKVDSNYWKELLKSQADLEAAFKKFGLDKIGQPAN